MRMKWIFCVALLCASSFGADLSYEVKKEWKLTKAEKKKEFATTYLSGVLEGESLLGEKITAPFKYYHAKDQAPLVLIFPPLAMLDAEERAVARILRNNGYNAIIVLLNDDLANPDTHPKEVNSFFRRNLLTASLLMNWAVTEKHSDRSRIAAFGISLGGIRASLAMGIFDEIRAIITYVAGGDLPSMIAQSTNPVIEEYREHWMKKLKLQSQTEFEKLMRSYAQVDPLQYAHPSRRDDVLMCIGNRDRQVPTTNQYLLWKAYGEPQMTHLPLGHVLTGMSSLVHQSRTIRFLDQKLK